MKRLNIRVCKSYPWAGVAYPVYHEDTVFPDDSDYPVCPRCHDDFGIMRIVTVTQQSFWGNVSIACCTCKSCSKPFSVRRFDEYFEAEEEVIHIFDKHPADTLLVRDLDSFGGGHDDDE